MKTVILAILPITLLTACAGSTHLTVERVDDSKPADGMVYYLPKPILVVQPQGDGTMQANFEFVPDPDNAYAIDGNTYLGKQTLDIELTEQGFLRKLDWKPDSTLLSEGIKAAAEIKKAKIEQESKDKEAEEEKRKEEKGKAETKLVEATKALETAKSSAEEQREKIAKLHSELNALMLKLEQLQLGPTVSRQELDKLDLKIFQKQQELDNATDADKQALQDQLAVLNKERELLLSNEDGKNGLLNAKNLEIFTKQEDVRLANEKLVQIEVKITALTEATESQQTIVDSYASANIPTDTKSSDEIAWGPVFYQLLDGRDLGDNPVVTLKPISFFDANGAVEAQPQYATLPQFPTKQVEFKPFLSHVEASASFIHPFRRASVVNAQQEVRAAQLKLDNAPSGGEEALRIELEITQIKLDRIREQERTKPVNFAVLASEAVTLEPGGFSLCRYTGAAATDNGFEGPAPELNSSPPEATEKQASSTGGTEIANDGEFGSGQANYQTVAGGNCGNGFEDTYSPAFALPLTPTKIQVSVPIEIETPGVYQVVMDLQKSGDVKEAAITFTLE